MAYVTLTTDAKNFHKTSFTVNSGTAITKTLTATKPASNSSVTVGTAVVGASLNYLKVKTYSSANTLTTMYVFGWSWVTELNAYVPQLLASLTPTFSTATQDQSALGLGTVYEVTNYTVATGDAKVFSGPTTTTAGGFALIDTLGCEFIEFCSTSSASNAVTILYAGV